MSRRDRRRRARLAARQWGTPASAFELQALESRTLLSIASPFVSDVPWQLLDQGTQWFAGTVVGAPIGPRPSNSTTTGDGATVTATGASISGSLWEDDNANRARDPGEGPLVGWTVYLDLETNGQLDAADPATTTDELGQYSFTGLDAGTYHVAQVVPTGWVQTVPAISVGGQSEAVDVVFTTDHVSGDEDAQALATVAGEIVPLDDAGLVLPTDAQSDPLIDLTTFRADSRFAGIDGSGLAVVIIDTGIDLNHPAFGPDADSNGVADRIVYHYDFSGSNDASAQDFSGHGSNVSSIIASQSSSYLGVAPGVDIIHLKVFPDSGSGGTFGDIEEALQWAVNNAATYNIAAVNMSLSDGGNYTTNRQLYGISDEMAALAAMDIITVSAAGNAFYTFDSATGVAYPAADPYSLAVGAVYDANIGGVTYGSGAQAYGTAADRVAPFSQRHATMMDVLAPGAAITGANATGGTTAYHGTSQAAPHVAGAAVLAQQLAIQTLGRRLTFDEFATLMIDSADLVYDGDDENDNVTNTNAAYPRLNMLALGEAILALGTGSLPGQRTVVLDADESASGVDFASQALPASVSGKIFNDYNGDGLPGANDGGLSAWTIYADLNTNGHFDAGEPATSSSANGAFTLFGLQHGNVRIAQLLLPGWTPTLNGNYHDLTLNPGESLGNVYFGNRAVSATPSTPVLLPQSDTGALDGDGITRLNNADPQSTLTFRVTNVVPNATVELLADGVVVGSAYVSSLDVEVIITTDGSTLLNDGARQFTAVQTEVTKLPSSSTARSITIDSTAPAIAVTPRQTLDTSPLISGAIDDPNAVVQVEVGGVIQAAINHGDGSWSLPAGTFAPFAPGLYSIIATATDVAGNVASDPTADELIILDPTGDLAGILWHDIDANGEIDAGESPLPGRVVYLDLDGDYLLDGDEPRTLTDGEGRYSLLDVLAGSYTLRQVLPEGWMPTVPTHGSAVEVLPGSVQAANLGSRQAAYVQNADANNLVVIEAESHHGVTSVNGMTWTPTSFSGASGGVMQATPNAGVGIGTGFVENSPRIDYSIQFAQAGTYYVWLRGVGATSGDDSVHVGLDGQAVNTADNALINAGVSLGWTRDSIDGTRLTIEVPSAGLHTLNIWMREDGAMLDRVLLTTSSGYSPGSSVGPAASTRETYIPPGPEIVVSGNGVEIADGDTSPTAADGTDFGIVALGSVVTRTFTVRNTGNDPLLISSLSTTAPFSVVEGLDAVIQPGGSDTFTLSLDTANLVDTSVNVVIANNDLNEGSTVFRVSGEVVAVAPEAYQQAATGDHLVVMEAELNDGVVAQGSYNWIEVSRSGASGTAMQATPNTGGGVDSGFVANSPRIDLAVNFTTAGWHYIWLRGLGETSGDDSVHVGLDGQAVDTADRASLRAGSTFGWTSTSIDGSALRVYVDIPGVHTVNLWMREDGAIVDRVLLTTSSSYNPGSGIGPATSARTSPTPAPEIALSGNGVAIANNDNTPSAADGTDFGIVTPGSPAVLRTFTVQNTGSADLDTSNLSVPDGFTVIEPLSATIAPGGSDTFTVALDTATAGTFAGLVSFNTSDSDENPTRFQITGTVGVQAPPAYQQGTDANGLVVIEAELNDGVVSVGGQTWVQTSTSGASGSVMQALPNSGTGIGSGYDGNSPRLDFRIAFNRTGVHYIWLRGLGATSADDSIHVGFDGQPVTTADNAVLRAGSSLGWTSTAMDGIRLTINVTSVGVHTLNLWMREDGAIVDRILLSSSSSYNPGSGVGPGTSARA